MYDVHCVRELTATLKEKYAAKYMNRKLNFSVDEAPQQFHPLIRVDRRPHARRFLPQRPQPQPDERPSASSPGARFRLLWRSALISTSAPRPPPARR